ncbi:hypothetical protein SAMN05192549_1136 [Duganella sacchari]|uniref:Uncharacterized protein n=2 Tax=Duganella sacchari TaxID=551987 RepID=A0A1M7R688_9BURK|nr:hypothetical protein SAMN05192549_1136 [Duganella sacchari]
MRLSLAPLKLKMPPKDKELYMRIPFFTNKKSSDAIIVVALSEKVRDVQFTPIMQELVPADCAAVAGGPESEVGNGTR